MDVYRCGAVMCSVGVAGYRAVSSVGRAADFYSACHRFDSGTAYVWTFIERAWLNGKAAVHGLSHKHIYLSRDLEQMIICSQRWPFGNAVIKYRQHAHAQWITVATIEDFEETLSLGGKWDAYE